MTKPIRLHVESLDLEAVASLDALLAAVEDAWPPGLGRAGDLSRADLIRLRDQAAEALWNGQVVEGQLSLRWLHRESGWKTSAERSSDDLVQVHQGLALIDLLDLLIAGLRGHDRVRVEHAPEAARG